METKDWRKRNDYIADETKLSALSFVNT
jgi:hypothetical protein